MSALISPLTFSCSDNHGLTTPVRLRPVGQLVVTT